MTIRIGSCEVGAGAPCFIVAELSANHNGSLERALETVRAAALAGADAIKLQTYRPDTITLLSDRPDFVVGGNGPWAGRTLYDLYAEAHTPWEWHAALFEEARKAGLVVFSTPFDETAVALLESLGTPAYKIASFELVDDLLLERVAATRKPVILSTGMATLEEIAHAMEVLRRHGANDIIALRCTSSYPAPDASMNLCSIGVLSDALGCPVGLSDHSLGAVAPIVAVTLGAVMIEKHFTLSRSDGGVDSHFSLEPEEFAALVRDVRRAEAMAGRPSFGAGAAEEGSVVFRRSLYVTTDVAEGEVLTGRNVRSVRPGHGLAPRYAPLVYGRRATHAAVMGTPVTWELVGAANGDGS
ncbi:MAG: pseudaminic acid synthase [Gemmatimonadota bacterium]